MSLVLESQPVPLHADADGVVRVAGTRVTLDTVVAAFTQGATAEQIAHDYPVLSLMDIYAVITFYLRQREAEEAYLAEQNRTGQHIRHRMEARSRRGRRGAPPRAGSRHVERRATRSEIGLPIGSTSGGWHNRVVARGFSGLIACVPGATP